MQECQWGSGLGWGAGLLTGVRWNCPTPFSPHWSIYSDRQVKTDPSFSFLFSLKHTHNSQWPFYCQISVQLQLFSFFALRSSLSQLSSSPAFKQWCIPQSSLSRPLLLLSYISKWPHSFNEHRLMALQWYALSSFICYDMPDRHTHLDVKKNPQNQSDYLMTSPST